MAAEKEGNVKTEIKDSCLLRIQADWNDGLRYKMCNSLYFNVRQRKE